MTTRAPKTRKRKRWLCRATTLSDTDGSVPCSLVRRFVFILFRYVFGAFYPTRTHLHRGAYGFPRGAGDARRSSPAPALSRVHRTCPKTRTPCAPHWHSPPFPPRDGTLYRRTYRLKRYLLPRAAKARAAGAARAWRAAARSIGDARVAGDVAPWLLLTTFPTYTSTGFPRPLPRAARVRAFA